MRHPRYVIFRAKSQTVQKLANIIDLRASIPHNRYMKRYGFLALIFIFAAGLYICTVIHAEDPYPQQKFFTIERFSLAANLLDAITLKPGLREDIKKFANYFRDGIYALSNGKYRIALDNLYKARRIWPEYFGTDFLIALALEKKGDIRKAARFYKGYLDKLRIFELGHYPISAPLIRTLSLSSIDNYSESNQRVAYHLKKYDIDLTRINPPVFISDFVKIALLLFLILIAGIIARYTIVPYLEIRNRIKRAAPGYWVCRKCGELNLDLVNECDKCGSKHP